MKRINLLRKPVTAIVTTLIVLAFLVTGGLASILYLPQINQKFGGATNPGQDVDTVATNYGDGNVYDMRTGNVYNMDASGLPTGPILRTFIAGTGRVPAANETQFNYTILQGEMIKDTFQYWSGLCYYPTPDADLIGIETVYYSDPASFVRYYGRIPGVTTFRIIATQESSAVLKERAVTITITVLENPLFSHTNDIKKGTIAERTFTPGTINLNSIVDDASNHEIMGVGRADNALETEMALSSGIIAALSTNISTKIRSGNSSFTLLSRGDRLLSPRRPMEVIVKHKTSGKIYFIPIIQLTAPSYSSSMGVLTQAYKRTNAASGNRVSIGANVFIESPFSPIGFWINVFHHTNPQSFIPYREQYPTGGGAGTQNQLSFSSMPAYSVPMGITLWMARYPTNNTYVSGLGYVVNAPNWSSNAPKPKAYTGSIAGTGIGSNNSADYPTVNLEKRETVSLHAEDIASLGGSEQLNHRFSVNILLINN